MYKLQISTELTKKADKFSLIKAAIQLLKWRHISFLGEAYVGFSNFAQTNVINLYSNLKIELNI